jgi:hypothetical protein
MAEESKQKFTWKHVLMHSGIVIAISILTGYVIHQDVCATASDYISGVGSVASIYAIGITLWQLRQVKRVAQAAKDASQKKSEEIVAFTTFAEIARHQEMCSGIVSCIYGEQYEAAAMKLNDIRKLLIEIRERNWDYADKTVLNKLISDIGNDSVNLRNRWMLKTELDTKVVLKHMNRVSNVLSDISANLKNKKL